jgi:hypothetical protein
MGKKFRYISSVSDEQFDLAMKVMEQAIAKMDTPEEWAQFAGKVLVFTGKIAINHFGFGPVLDLAGEVFKDNEEILKLLEMLGEVTDETN